MRDAESPSQQGDSFRSAMTAGVICAAVSTLFIRLVLILTAKGEPGNNIQEGWQFQLAAASQFLPPICLTLWFVRRQLTGRPLVVVAAIVVAVSSQACGTAMFLLTVNGTELTQILLQHLRPLVWIGLHSLFLCRLTGVPIRWLRFAHLIAVIPLAWATLNDVFHLLETRTNLHFTADNNTWCLIAAPLLWYLTTNRPLPFAWQPAEATELKSESNSDSPPKRNQ